MPLNHNVKLALWWSLFENLSDSVRFGDAFSAYIYLLSGKTSTVGFIQGLNGTTQLLVALPVGHLCDVVRRDRMLRVGALVGAVAAVTLATALTLNLSMVHLAACACLLGCYRGIHSVAMESIFADSVEAGRSSMYTKKFIVTALASGAGPVISLFLFLAQGNTWRTSDCRRVVMAGLGLIVIPLCLMLFLDDDAALGAASDAVVLGGPPPAPATQNAEDMDMEAHTEIDPGDGVAAAPLLRPWDGGDVPAPCCPPALLVGSLLTASDLLSALASGMTVKFFAIFFLEQCKLRPVSVAALAAAAPCGVAVASALAQRCALRLGRVEVSLVTRLADVALLSSMAFMPPLAAAPTLVVVHLLRTALANSTRPLMRSILMEVVPKRLRGRVNAIDSVTNLSWSGSAALGGVLIQRLGFQGTFLVTAGIKLAAYVPVLALLFVTRELALTGRQQPGWRRQRRGGAKASGYEALPDVHVGSDGQEANQTRRA